ncbi:hypothetical protein LX14_000663 [Williamsia deligens]|nr:hypothetical protein [Williamsia deligens]
MQCHHGRVRRHPEPDWYPDDDWDDDPQADEKAGASDSDSDGTDGPAGDEEVALPTVGRAATPTGSVEVRTTMQGLPTSIHIEPSEMDRSATRLARTILLLCRQAGARAGAAHRAELLAQGHPLEAVSYLQLPTDRDVAALDRQVDDFFDDEEPSTWMRRA